MPSAPHHSADTPREQSPRRSRLHAIARYALYGTAGLVVVILLASVAWKASGSNEWELEFERNGVLVHSLKAPGTFGKQFRATMVADYSLDHLVAGLIENSTEENCRKHIPNCIDVRVIKPWSSKVMSDTVLWKLALPGPFKPREVIMRSQVMQNPETEAVTIHLIAAPNAVPYNQDAVRVSHVQNRWTFTPLDNGKVKIEFLQDMSMGGMMPTTLVNLAGAEEVYKFIHDQLPALLDNKRIKQMDYKFIKES